MKNVLLMSVFGMLMTVAFGGQSVSGVSLVSAAYASGNEHGHDDDHEHGYGGACPDGVATCIRADGSSYTDLNNLPATASGNENDDGTTSATTSTTTGTDTFANPRNQRSF
ncbi:hypothetical protein D8Y20_07510 [Mariprofundus sp. EBB-1]|uniref:hypothetical protein n=1 Tax=Mariprofundus sp. EBB-1 TaxID=2650971 RepID=UPI000EF1A54F|nr:hypothetical protein [Mariprofundus sp. EBB-1]RLL52240.1 hypothetical protein D8Y20_07510 [Mariprofundus sp. EBB-1]